MKKLKNKYYAIGDLVETVNTFSSLSNNGAIGLIQELLEEREGLGMAYLVRFANNQVFMMYDFELRSL